jgi:hypothetical protein
MNEAAFVAWGDSESAEESVMYELVMMERAIGLLRTEPAGKEWSPEWLDHSLALEGFLLHARALHEFFRRTGRVSDVRASRWLPGHGIEMPLEKDDNTAIGQYVAHITDVRSARGGWRVNHMHSRVRASMAAFFNQLDDAARSRFKIGDWGADDFRTPAPV